MDQEIKKEWVEALRSGEYVQGQRRLHEIVDEEHKYCCLGVLCEIAKKHKVNLPIRQYFSDKAHNVVFVEYDGYSALLPPEVSEWSGVNGVSGILPDASTLSGHNDAGSSFDEIADMIERQL